MKVFKHNGETFHTEGKYYNSVLVNGDTREQVLMYAHHYFIGQGEFKKAQTIEELMSKLGYDKK